MSFNARMLETFLTDASFVRVRSKWSDYPLDTLSLLPPQMPSDTNLLMVASASDLEAREDVITKGCIISSGTPSTEWLMRNRVDIFCYPESYEVRELAAYANKVVGLIHRWFTNLISATFRNDSLQHVCIISREILRTDVTIIAPDFTVLAQVEQDDSRRTRKTSSRTSDYLDKELVSLLLGSPEFMQTIDSKEPGYFSTGDASSNMYQNIFVGGDFAGRIILSTRDGRQLGVGYKAFLNLLGFSVQTLMRTGVHPRNRYASQLRCRLEGYFDDSRVFTRPLESYLEPLGWRMDDLYSVVALRPESGLASRGVLEYVGYAITMRVAGTIQFMVDKTLVIVYNYRVNGEDLWKLFDDLKDYVAEYSLFAGLSEGFYDFADIETYIRQAIAALDCGLRNDFPGTDFFFPDVRLRFMIEEGVFSLPPKALISKGIRSLLAYDEENDTSLYETLRTYVLNHLNKTDSAKALFCHMSTLRYRLERIEQIADLDFEDPDTLLYLMLLIKLLDEA